MSRRLARSCRPNPPTERICKCGVELIPNFSNNSVDIHVEAYYTGNSPQSTNYMHVAILLDGVVGPQGSAKLYNPADVVSDGPNCPMDIMSMITCTKIF